MALVIETGAVVAGANSYLSLADAQAFILARGLDETTMTEATMIQAFDYVNSFESQYQGSRVSADQTGSFPRYNVIINGFAFASDEIPQQLKDAQAYAAYYESQTVGILQPVTNGQTITHEEVTGAVAVDYADNGLSSETYSFPAISALLKPLFNAFGSSLRVIRV